MSNTYMQEENGLDQDFQNDESDHSDENIWSDVSRYFKLPEMDGIRPVTSAFPNSSEANDENIEADDGDVSDEDDEALVEMCETEPTSQNITKRDEIIAD